MTNKTLVPEPLLINEKLVVFFKHWMHEKIQDGIRSNGELFTHVSSFSAQSREQAYRYAWELAAQGIHVVITASTCGYKLWRSLRSFTKDYES